LAQQFLIGIAGAVVGVLGWLLVGLLLQRREHRREAVNCGRAVYFELGANRLTLFTASEYGSFGPLVRSTFDTFLPQLATWLRPAEVQTLVLPYLGHAGYADLAQRDDLPDELRQAALASLAEAHDEALTSLKSKVFSSKEIAELEQRADEQRRHLLNLHIGE
jgi:hypothetical protein